MAGITVTELGSRCGYSQSAFSQRLKRGKFTQEDLEQFVDQLGAKYFSGFEFPNGSRVE